MSNDRVKKFAQRLLVSTCLTVGASVAAQAGIITESTDFGNTFATATDLGPGATGVSGQVFNSTPSSNDFFDFVRFSGLTPGSVLHFTTTATNPGATFFEFLSSANTFITSVSPGNSVDVTVPTSPNDGIVVFEVSYEGGGETSSNYTASFTTTAAGVPEPGTIGGVGLGLAGAALAALRRKKQ